MRIYSRRICVLILFFVFFWSYKRVYAGEYVLPYPSFMPGNKLYTISRILDNIENWWFWGSIASFKYQLKLADKYLVEAKTLFEYKQYQLGTDALKRSDMRILLINKTLQKAKAEGKDVQKFETIATNAMNRHISVLKMLSKELPESFQWAPEKQKSTVINFSQLIHNSIAEREKLL